MVLEVAKHKERPPGAVLFDSLKECRRYVFLLAEQRAGRIQNLTRQVRFNCKVGPRRSKVCCYVADFTYIANGRRVVEDVKSPMTRKLPVYVLKKKLLLALFDVEIQEV